MSAAAATLCFILYGYCCAADDSGGDGSGNVDVLDAAVNSSRSDILDTSRHWL